MSKFRKGDKVRVKERPGYTLGGWEGEIVEVKEDPKGYVIMLATKTGYRMAFPEDELEKVEKP